MKWEERAKIIYTGTKWENKAIDAGILMDNRLDGKDVSHETYGLMGGKSSSFDMFQYLAYFDWDVLVRRGLQNKEIKYIISGE